MMFNLNSLKTFAVLIFLAVLIAGCGKTDQKDTGKTNTDKTEAKGTVYNINTTESIIEWNGKKVTGNHNGTVNISSGEIIIDGSSLTGGKVEADMTTLKVSDLADPEMNGKLTGHLKSDDFFSVEKSPKAIIQITGVKKISETEYEVNADLTIKGITHPITFPATVYVTGSKATAEATLNVDRTLYDIKFRSGKFFENLGDNLISDIFTLKVKIASNS